MKSSIYAFDLGADFPFSQRLGDHNQAITFVIILRLVSEYTVLLSPGREIPQISDRLFIDLFI